MTANTTPRERPILFSEPMVRAIDGHKTQTRRMVKPTVAATLDYFDCGNARDAVVSYSDAGHDGPCLYVHCGEYPEDGAERIACPYGLPGDRLWVRETWLDDGTGEPGNIHYRASASYGDLEWLRTDGHKWRPSIFMPRWASRLTLEITDVRVERLQDISEEDIRAEGVTAESVRGLWTSATLSARREVKPHGPETLPSFDVMTPQLLWLIAWQLINGRASWDANPWVWVISFRRVDARAEAA